MTERPPRSKRAAEISVVCAWYNRAGYLRDTLDSLLAQEFESFEVILVNDGSPDPRVREILDGYDDRRLRVIHQENTGFVRAVRRAIAASSAPFVAIQGAGDVSAPQRLARQHAFLSQHPDFAIVGCRYVSVVKSPAGEGIRRLSKSPGREPQAAEIRRGNPFGHGEVMIRRAHYDAVGGYRTFFANAQDKDLWLRLSMHYRLSILDEVLYERRIFTEDGITADLKKTLQQVAYSRVADLCHIERRSGREDSVDAYGTLALMRVPAGPLTIYRVIRAVRQMATFGTLDARELRHATNLFGRVAGGFAILTYALTRLARRS